ncbi:MAG TPA: sensor histidine kinase [Turneriella sp.]|nr:sensor histidine kinase [Turneriella sp.]
MRHLRWLLLLLSSALACAVSCSGGKGARELKAVGGVLDLSQHDFHSEPVITLGGEWLYYPDQLLTSAAEAKTVQGVPVIIPQTWSGYGFGTYHLRLTLPDAHEIFKLHMEAQLSAYDVYISGVRRAASGLPGKTMAETKPATEPLSAVLGAAGEYDIFLRVANFHHRKGGVFKKIQAGRAAALDHLVYQKRFLDILLVGVLLMSGIYYFIVFLFRPRNKAELFFAAVCFMIMGRTVTTGEKILLLSWPEAPFAFYTMVEYLSYFWGIPFALSFFSALYGRLVHRFLLRGFYISSVVFSLPVVLLPLRLYSHTAYLYIPVLVAGLIVVVLILGRALLQGLPSAGLLAGGFSVLALAVMNDAFNTLELLRTGYLVQYGFMAIVVCYSAVLAARFSQALESSERAEQALREANETLEARVKERTQELESAKDVAEEANRQKDNFLAVVSHDLRSPLSGILSALQAMGLSASGGELAAAAEKSAVRMLKTIDSLLAVRRIGNAPRPVDAEVLPGRIAGEILSEMEAEAAKKKIRLLNELPTHWAIPSNPEVLRHVLRNLLSNAVKFTPAGGCVLIYRPDGDRAAITVRDEGIGIGPEDIAAILGSKKITPRPGVSGEKSSGLGLSLCRELLAREGARLEIVSEPGKGSAFTIVWSD